MQLVRDGTISQDQALELARKRHQAEVHPISYLCRQSLLSIHPRSSHKCLHECPSHVQKKERELREHQEMVSDFYELLRAIEDSRQQRVFIVVSIEFCVLFKSILIEKSPTKHFSDQAVDVEA